MRRHMKPFELQRILDILLLPRKGPHLRQVSEERNRERAMEIDRVGEKEGEEETFKAATWEGGDVG